MAESSIEIFQRTLLKLLIRRGTNADRTNVVLSEGELGYTTDTEKLYVGDGSTYGGIQVTGSKFLGAAGDITTLAPADLKDLAFSTSNNTLYYIVTNDGALLSDWAEVAGVYTNTDGTISIDTENNVKLGDVAGQSLAKDVNNKLILDDTIYFDRVTKKNGSGTSYLGLPQKVSFGSINYTTPTSGAANTYLKLNSSGQLTWSNLTSTATSFVNTEVFPVGTIIPYASTVLPSNGRFLNCDGSYVQGTVYSDLSAVLGSTYGPLSTLGGNSYVKLPDLRGRSPLGFANSSVTDLSGIGRTFSLGSVGGLYETSLTQAYIPAHSHNVVSNSIGVSSVNGSNPYLASNDGIYHLSGNNTVPTFGTSTSWGASAGVNPINNLQPYTTTNFIIKALADPIANCSINIFDSLSAKLGNTPVSVINPLSGTYTIGLDSIVTPIQLGYIRINNKGLVNSYDTSFAGDLGSNQPSGANTSHQFGFINFLRTAVPIVNDTIWGTPPANWQRTFDLYPTITDGNSNDASPLSNLPLEAKNVIIDVRVPPIEAEQCMFAAASDTSQLASGMTAGGQEHCLYQNDNGNVEYQHVGQFIIPCSNNGGNTKLQFAMRGYDPNQVGGIIIRVVGWTL